MSRSIEPADRRPLVYGVFVLMILVAASYLFWPRSPQPDALVLTPESVRTGSAAAEMNTAPEEGETTPVETVEVAAANDLAVETSISDEPPATDPAPAKPKETAKTDTAKPKTATAARPATHPSTGSGDWVVNAGAFSTEASARSRTAELSRLGMSAHVHRIEANGQTLWRVRVGYFETKAKAREYGDWMKSTHGIEGWAGAR